MGDRSPDVCVRGRTTSPDPLSRRHPLRASGACIRSAGDPLGAATRPSAGFMGCQVRRRDHLPQETQ
jgi:hypothetical protein